MIISVDTVDKFQDVINSVDQEMIPIDYVKKVVFRLRTGKRRTINLDALRKQKLHIEDIEQIVNRSILDFGSDISKVNFVLDIRSIATKIEPLTRKYLEKL
jgi:hypothetical protein